jgi:2-C-methyl-D-erythritol 4-phosphate cytidylyltransferase
VNKGCDIWAVIPAAGIGRRMQSDKPKQYLKLIDRAVIEHTIDRLLAVDQVKGIVISIQPGDPYWPGIRIESDKPVVVAAGGEERCHSVMSALELLSKQPAYNHETTWVLVHDAVRPCVSTNDIQNLIDTAAGTESGGLTPQLFACNQLSRALENALAEGFLVTDESSAMEHAGHRPRLVQGREDNIKITRPADLRLAELYLKSLSEKPGTGECI